MSRYTSARDYGIRGRRFFLISWEFDLLGADLMGLTHIFCISQRVFLSSPSHCLSLS